MLIRVIAVDQVIDAHVRSAIPRPWPLAGMLVFLIGLGGLLSDSLKLQQPRFLNAHLLFGVVLLAVITRRLLKASHSLRDPCGDQFYLHTRRLARQVYILLYTMAGLRLCLYVVEGAEARNAGRVFGYFASRSSLDDFHVYLGYGLAAACLIRGTAMFVQVPMALWARR